MAEIGVDPAAWSPWGACAGRLPATRPGLTLAAPPTPAAWLLQADPEDAGFGKAAAAALGLAPPAVVGDVAAAADGRRILALGPDMWLLVAPTASAPDDAALRALVDRFDHASAMEQTEARRWLAVDGPAAEELLARFVTLDLALPAFPAGTARGCRIGQVTGLIERVSPERFLVAGPTSTAEHMAAAFLDALDAVAPE